MFIKDTRDDGPSWLDGTLRNYEAFYGKQLRVPRWYEIESKYYLKKKEKVIVCEHSMLFSFRENSIECLSKN